MILERVLAVQLVKEHVEKFAIPYMLEHNLKKDETLYTYIKVSNSYLTYEYHAFFCCRI